MANIIPSRRNRGDGGSLMPRRAGPLGQLRDEFDSLFDRFFGQWPATFGGDWEPQRFWNMDVADRDNEYLVTADMPGFSADDIDLHLNNNVLTIEAEEKHEKKEEGGYERSFRSFRRSFTLPAGVDPNKIEASYRNGVLELHLPKSEQARGRRIPVQGAKAPPATAENQPARSAKKS
jgi:HSP20 family protein